MRLSALHKVLTEGRITTLSIPEIIDALNGRTLVIFNVDATSDNPDADYFQILRISAVAIDTTKQGREVGQFDAISSLSISALREIDRQDRLIAAGQWDGSSIPIRDILSQYNYDIEDETERPQGIELAIRFRSFIYGLRNPVLIGYEAHRDLYFINEELSQTFIKVPVFDMLEFAKIYFEPILRVMVRRGSKKAQEMSEKIWDAARGEHILTAPNLGRVFGVHANSALANSARKLASIFPAMFKFIQSNKALIQDPEYIQLSDQAKQTIKYPTEWNVE